MNEHTDVTALLTALSGGRRDAFDRLMPIIYDQLRLLAHRHLRNERSDHTLNTTALVNEAYLKLINVQRVRWQDRTHFFAMASRAMRRILIDYARTRKREKRGGAMQRISLTHALNIVEERREDLLALDDALRRLEEVDERRCRVVECRFFGGLSVKETAEALEISEPTVKRDWAVTRAWLNRELRNAATSSEGRDAPDS